MNRFLPAVLGGFFVATTAGAAPFAYVPNEKSGTVSVIDTATDTVVRTIPAGEKPRGIAVSVDGRTLYVSDQPKNALATIDVESGRLGQPIDLGESPEGVGISPDGKWIVVAIEKTNSANFVDTATGKRVFSLPYSRRSGFP